jgi:hypothetical protein
MCITAGYADVRQLSVLTLQNKLREQGAVLDGTH